MVITEQKLRIEDTCAFGFEFDPDALSYNNVKEACHVALAVAVMGMVFGIVGFVLEIVVEKGGAVMIVVKKFIFLGLMILAIVVAVLWIATFIYLIYLWENKTTSAHLVDETKNSARGVLALTFLSGATKVSCLQRGHTD